MTDIYGICNERFEKVREALAESLDGIDVGASAAVYLDGEPVVDLWGGYTDAARTRPWERDTIVNVWSTTKPMTALCVLILADRGALDLDAPVAKYWPEFSARDVLVRHVLAHSAGLPEWDVPVSVEDLYDWPKVTGLLAAQAPRWEPGTVPAYHVVTQGFLLGEVVRRVTGRTLGTFFAEEVAGPLGADFHIGLPPAHHGRVADLIPEPDATPFPGEPPNPVVTVADANSAAWREAEIPAGNGHGNARAIAAVQSVLPLLSREMCERVLEVQVRGVDQVLGVRMAYGLGYSVNGRTCMWGGRGGSLVMVDLDARMVVAYAMNQMLERLTGDERGLSIVFAAYDGLSRSR